MQFDPLRRAVGAAAAALLLSGTAHAVVQTGYDAIYAFGDSLTDVGNIYTLSGGADPAPPYYNGQFSNGNVWLQTLAADAGLAPVTASVLGGTDYAYGGAQSGGTIFHTANFTDVAGTGGQIAQFTTAHPVADPGALYTLWIGGNDLLGLLGQSNLTQQQIATLAAQTVGNIDTAIAALAGLGAKKFLVLTLPDVGKTPEAIAAGASATGSAVAASFNALLLGGNSGVGIPSLAGLAGSLGLTLNVLDAYAFTDAIAANGNAYGFTNTTQACFDGTNVCANPGQYAFWDSIHPTGAAHALLGADAAAVAGVPEPATWALMFAGIGVVAAALRRRA